MPRFLKHLLAWTLICGLSAAPSFALGINLDDTLWGMLVGVAVFIVGYTAFSCTPLAARIYADRRRRRAIKIGYATRLAMSLASAMVFLEVGFFIIMPDVACGVMSVGATSKMLGREEGFLFALSATLLQGTALNLMLGIYTLIVYAICRYCMAPDDACRPQGFEVLPIATPAIPITPTLDPHARAPH